MEPLTLTVLAIVLVLGWLFFPRLLLLGLGVAFILL